MLIIINVAHTCILIIILEYLVRIIGLTCIGNNSAKFIIGKIKCTRLSPNFNSNIILFPVGITMTSSVNIGTVGSSITFSCSSDLDPVRIEWYRNNAFLSQTYATSSSVTLGQISTDDEGAVYTCNAVGQHGSQERNKTLQVKGKRVTLFIVVLCQLRTYDVHFNSARQLGYY
jgi:hypothetical protein